MTDHQPSSNLDTASPSARIREMIDDMEITVALSLKAIAASRKLMDEVDHLLTRLLPR